MVGEADLAEDFPENEERHPDERDEDRGNREDGRGESRGEARGEGRGHRGHRGGRGGRGGGRGHGHGHGGDRGGDDRGNRGFRDNRDSRDDRDDERGESRGNTRDEDFEDRREDREFEGRETAPRAEDGAVPQVEAPRRPAPNRAPEEEFAIQVYYDKANQIFLATCLEFPDLKVDGHRREDVVEEMNQKIGDELEMMRREGKPLPTPFSARTYPEKLEVRLSKNLFRRLDIQSRQDRVPMDQLVTELLTIALNRRPDGMGRPQQGGRQQGQGQHKGQHGGGNRRGGGQGGGGGGGNRGRNYHDTMGNRDNFMEYVRNLEKSGGFGKKR